VLRCLLVPGSKISDVDINTERMQQFESGDVTTYVTGVISDKASGSGGVYPLFDSVSGQQLKLTFDYVDFDRTLAGYVRDRDFWVHEHGGKLTVDEVKVHKVPEKQLDGSYIQIPRYNFDDLKFDVAP